MLDRGVVELYDSFKIETGVTGVCGLWIDTEWDSKFNVTTVDVY